LSSTGKVSCASCHNGSLFTDNHFHNTGVPLPETELPPYSGRTAGVRNALAAEFSCTSEYSDAKPEECKERDQLVAFLRTLSSPVVAPEGYLEPPVAR
jgi:hypothetical protein